MQTLNLSRRGLLRGAGVAAGAGALLAAGLAAGPAAAQAKFSQSQAKYQPTPKGAQRCDSCAQFQPAAACKVVQGQISASGWCLLYAHK
jgi:secreted PhoX family phosphatase